MMLRKLLFIGCWALTCTGVKAQSAADAVIFLQYKATSSNPSYFMKERRPKEVTFHIAGDASFLLQAKQISDCLFSLESSSKNHDIYSTIDFSNAVWSDVHNDRVTLHIPGVKFCRVKSKNGYLPEYNIKDGQCSSAADFLFTDELKSKGPAAIAIIKKSCPGRAF